MKGYRKLLALGVSLVLIVVLITSLAGCVEFSPSPEGGGEANQGEGNYTPGLHKDSGELEPGVKTVTSSSGGSPSYVVNLELPPISQQRINELKWFIEITIDDMTEDTFFVVGVRLNETYLVSALQGREAYQIHATGTHTVCGRIQSSQGIFTQDGDNKYEIILYTSSGEAATISSLRVYHAWNQKIPLSVAFWNHQAAKSLVALDFMDEDIVATAKPANPQFSHDTSSCGPLFPFFIEPKRYVVGFDVNITSFSGGASKLNYEFTYNDNTIASGYFTSGGWHRNAGDFPVTSYGHQWDPNMNAMKLYLWVDQGTVTINCVRFMSGVGNAYTEGEGLDADASLVFELMNIDGLSNLDIQITRWGVHYTRLIVDQRNHTDVRLHNQLTNVTYGYSHIVLPEVSLNGGSLLLRLATASADTTEREPNCTENITGVAHIEF